MDYSVLRNNYIDIYYYGARYYDPVTSVFFGVDPMSDKYPSLSPFAYCADNPIMLIDPDGRDWAEVETSSGKDVKKEIQWFDSKKAFEKSGQKGTYLGKAAVVFNGSRDEKLGKDDNMYGKGAKLASVTVYGSKNKDDVKQYDGFTMSSDASSFGVVADGDYSVNRTKDKGPYNSEWAVNDRNSVPALDNNNPAHPDRKPGFLTGVFIHRPNNDGWAGTYNDNGKKHGVSEGCLLIAPKQWTEFNKQLKNVDSFFLRIKR